MSSILIDVRGRTFEVWVDRASNLPVEEFGFCSEFRLSRPGILTQSSRTRDLLDPNPLDSEAPKRKSFSSFCSAADGVGRVASFEMFLIFWSIVPSGVLGG